MFRRLTLSVSQSHTPAVLQKTTQHAASLGISLLSPEACNTGEAGEELFRERAERVAGRFFLDHALTRSRPKAEEVFQSSEFGGLHVLSKNPFQDGSFVRNGKSFLEGRPPSSPHEREHDKQAQPPDSNTTFISQEAAGTVDFK